MNSRTRRFACDRMLGRLARWLRMAGYDTRYPPEMDDAALSDLCTKEERTLLTRDEGLAGKHEGAVLIVSTDLDGQLREVAEYLERPLEARMDRCTVCNGSLSAEASESVKGEVEDGVLERHNEFYRCKECGKIYWKGTHWKGIAERLSRTGPCNNPSR